MVQAGTALIDSWQGDDLANLTRPQGEIDA